MRKMAGVLVVVFGVAPWSGVFAQDASRWTGFYAGGHVGASSDDVSSYGSAPCHVGCSHGSGSLGAQSGYQTGLGDSGVVGGFEGDVSHSR